MTTCEMCGDNVASVFTPTLALCRRCYRAADELASWDNPIPNEPTCATCGAVLHRSHCHSCIERALVDGHAAMRVSA